MCTHLLFITTVDSSDESDTTYSDFNRPFPFTWTTWNQYIFVIYEYNINSTLVLAMKN